MRVVDFAGTARPTGSIGLGTLTYRDEGCHAPAQVRAELGFTSPLNVTTSLMPAAVQTLTNSSSSMGRRVSRSRFHTVTFTVAELVEHPPVVRPCLAAVGAGGRRRRTPRPPASPAARPRLDSPLTEAARRVLRRTCPWE